MGRGAGDKGQKTLRECKETLLYKNMKANYAKNLQIARRTVHNEAQRLSELRRSEKMGRGT